MSGPAPRQLVTLALKNLLGQHAGLKVYNGFLPDNPALPFAVLHTIDGGRYDGPYFAAPDADAWYAYQVDVVGSRMDQVLKGSDEMRELILGREPDGSFSNELEVVAGYVWGDRLPSDTPGGVDVDKASSGTVFTASHRYTVVLTPSD